jgi:hypothetical protein
VCRLRSQVRRLKDQVELFDPPHPNWATSCRGTWACATHRVNFQSPKAPRAVLRLTPVEPPVAGSCNHSFFFSSAFSLGFGAGFSFSVFGSLGGGGFTETGFSSRCGLPSPLEGDSFLGVSFLSGLGFSSARFRSEAPSGSVRRGAGLSLSDLSSVRGSRRGRSESSVFGLGSLVGFPLAGLLLLCFIPFRRSSLLFGVLLFRIAWF